MDKKNGKIENGKGKMNGNGKGTQVAPVPQKKNGNGTGKTPKVVPQPQKKQPQKAVPKAVPKAAKKRGKQIQLDEQQVKEIRRLGKEGKMTQREIGEQVAPGYQLGNISRILSGKLWK